MRKIVFLALLVCCLVLSCCEPSCKTPNEPDNPDDPSKPTATVDFSVVENPFNVQNKSSQWYVDIHIKVKETGGVGVDITDVRTEWVKNDDPKSTTHSAGGRLPANGNVTLAVYSTCPQDIKADFLRITVIGKDDNDHDISVNHKWNIDWSGTLALQVY